MSGKKALHTSEFNERAGYSRDDVSRRILRAPTVSLGTWLLCLADNIIIYGRSEGPKGADTSILGRGLPSIYPGLTLLCCMQVTTTKYRYPYRQERPFLAPS